MTVETQAGDEDLRVVLSHDWLTGMRGGEKVLELLCERYPGAPIYTLFHNPAAISSAINTHQVQTSFLQRFPGIFGYYRTLLPLFPRAIEAMKPDAADLLVSTNHCVAKGLKVPEGTRHLCYCFTPMRYVWVFYNEYFGRNVIKKGILAPILERLRRWDYKTAQRVDRFVAISKHVRARIKKCYGRDADIVYPPVDTEFYYPDKVPSAEYDLIVSALVPYKRLDLAIRAYNRIGFPLKIIGIGTERESLQSLAGPNVELLGWLSNEEIRGYYRNCRCLVFPGEEDFGIVPVEAQACGRPVVAYAKGGALESIMDDESGVFFREQTEFSLQEAVERCAAKDWDVEVIRRNAERFSKKAFSEGFRSAVSRCMEE